MPWNKIHCPGDHEIYNLRRPFLFPHYYRLSLSDPCLGVKKIFNGIRHFYIMTYGHALSQEPLSRGS